MPRYYVHNLETDKLNIFTAACARAVFSKATLAGKTAVSSERPCEVMTSLQLAQAIVMYLTGRPDDPTPMLIKMLDDFAAEAIHYAAKTTPRREARDESVHP
jgi:hypothetical protein